MAKRNHSLLDTAQGDIDGVLLLELLVDNSGVAVVSEESGLQPVLKAIKNRRGGRGGSWAP